MFIQVEDESKYDQLQSTYFRPPSDFLANLPPLMDFQESTASPVALDNQVALKVEMLVYWKQSCHVSTLTEYWLPVSSFLQIYHSVVIVFTIHIFLSTVSTVLVFVIFC